MNKLLEIVFKNRGYDETYFESIEDASHNLLDNIDEFSEALYKIRVNNDKIVILPDFDMDGIMSGVLGYAGLTELGFNVSLFMPDPTDGYGFNESTIDRLVSEYPDTKVILTCDVGSSCHDGIYWAKTLGLDVIVTDHHQVVSKKPLPADCFVNPCRQEDNYEHKGICGAHVLYQCLEYFAEKYYNNFALEQIRRLRVFAGIGTISDMMPLLYENRPLVRDAVAMCKIVYSGGDSWFVDMLEGTSVYQHAFRGLFNVFKKFESMNKITNGDNIDEQFFGYYLAPMFNSVKRIGNDMRLAFDVFFSDTSVEAVDNLYELNELRKSLVTKYFEDIQNNHNPYAPYIYISQAPAGILGLLATQCMNITGMPTIVVRPDGDGFTGSGRSPVWYPMLSRCLAEKFYVAGHEEAFGVGITDKRELKSFYAFLDKDSHEIMSTLDMTEYDFKPDFVIATDDSGDTNIDIPLFNGYFHEMSRYKPFGQEFVEPVVLFKFKLSDCVITVMGAEKQHVKFRFNRGFEMLCWNQADLLDDIKQLSEITVVGHLRTNEFNNLCSVNFIGDLTYALSSHGKE